LITWLSVHVWSLKSLEYLPSTMAGSITIAPSEIRFSQLDISGRFRERYGLEETFHSLLYGKITPLDIESVEVVWAEDSQGIGRWWSYTGNRRLFIYRQLETRGVIETITANVRDLSDKKIAKKFRQQKTTRNDGISIQCRQGDMIAKLEKIIEDWKLKNRDEEESFKNLVIENIRQVDRYDDDDNYDDFVVYNSKSRKACLKY